MSTAEDYGQDTTATWRPVDLSGYLDGTYKPVEPVLMPRSDGIGLLYPGLTHSFHGEPESGKSLVAQAEAARILTAGGRVLFVDFESDPGAVVERVLSLGADRAAIAERFTYVQPDGALWQAVELASWLSVLDGAYDLAVIDGVTASLALVIDGAGSNDNDALAQWAQQLPEKIAKRTGAAVVSVDHVTKNAETRGGYAMGGQQKMARITGSAYVVEVVEPLGRGLRGVVALRVAKDRPGYIRARSGDWRSRDRTQEAARVVVDSTGDEMVVTVTAPEAGQASSDSFRPTVLMEKISRHLETDGGRQSWSQIRREVGGSTDAKRVALDVLVTEGYVAKTEGARNSWQHSSVKPYRESEDVGRVEPSYDPPDPSPYKEGGREDGSFTRPEDGSRTGQDGSADCDVCGLAVNPAAGARHPNCEVAA
ncbi:AAA family ATPase [Parenemella sanctibonifatiensis]|uniref:AAA family ATPase n=1 Tax=Parenemella sanctibonifatiensis TaxID=2016505 RepID=A0A255EIL6_9ACTN|nr:AAA family ATPase [Parenemella sanctibonifatiensis]OYN89282.1 hypothetical protein CGZ92_02905 [Parenemella sanctibonifatiensis]